MSSGALDGSSARAILSLGLLGPEAPDQSLLATAIRSSDDPRFTPGVVVADRFRIVALAGRGGMGDVYRADDLKLGQPVALKFLPVSSGPDDAMVRLFYDEVRLGRQVAHPNVCRIYDLLDVEGRPAIIMEFVEGEDLASLLQRSGRLPYRTALQIGRDVCAGVEAAHEKRIVHGDLKPANILIDGRGRAHITDFGLSRIVEDRAERTRIAGTIGYMPPEQFTAGALTPRGDIYSLGLVLYELFSGVRGRQVTKAEDVAAPLMPPLPSLYQPEIHPELERVILRCLEADPNARPSTARSIAAAFPPGDILDDLLAAGETPPAEFVAESRKVTELTSMAVRALTIGGVVLLVAVTILSQRLTLYGRTSLALTPAALSQRVRAIAAQLGERAPVIDEARWFDADLDARYAVTPGLPPILFHDRSGPAPLLTLAQDHHVHETQPPFGRGMTEVVLDTRGNLRLLRAQLPESEKLAGGEVAWPRLLRFAGIAEKDAIPVASDWIPPYSYDDKREWKAGGVTLRVAGFRGCVTFFEVFRAPAANRGRRTMRSSRLPYAVYFILVVSSLIAGAFLARRNIRRKLVDVRAAWRVTLWVLVCRAAFGLIAGHHPLSADAEVAFLSSIAGMSLLLAAQVWLGYAALEPYVRRRWPEAMIGWARVVHGRVRDAVVGRDLLLGAIAGLAMRLADHFRNLAASLPGVQVVPSHLAVEALGSLRETAGGIFLYQARAIFYALFGLFVLVLLRMSVRRTWLAAAVWLVATTVSWMRWDDPAVELPVVALQMTIALLVLQRLGLLAMTVAIYVDLLCVYTPITADPRAFYFAQSALATLAVAALIGYGAYAASRRTLPAPVSSA